MLNIHTETLPASLPHVTHMTSSTPQYVSFYDVDYQFSSHSLKTLTVRYEIYTYIDNCVSIPYQPSSPQPGYSDTGAVIFEGEISRITCTQLLHFMYTNAYAYKIKL